MKTLRDLSWFSFADDPREADALTIWQAIAHILMATPETAPALEEYAEALVQLEIDSASDIVDWNDQEGRHTQLMIEGEIRSVPAGHFDPDAHALDNICLPSGDIKDALDLLDMNRQTLVDTLPLPGLLHGLLASEIEGIHFRLRSVIKLVPDDFQTCIKRTCLKAWRESKHLESLGLVTADRLAQRRKVRIDATDNQLLVIGMLLQLLGRVDPEQYAMKVGTPHRKISKNKVMNQALKSWLS